MIPELLSRLVVRSFQFCLFNSVEIERKVGENSELSVALNKPWYGDFGLYNHFHQQIDGLTLRSVLVECL